MLQKSYPTHSSQPGWPLANVDILLQSALKPLWVMACLTIVEYYQQEGFYRVPLPSNPQLGGPVIRTFQLPPSGVPYV